MDKLIKVIKINVKTNKVQYPLPKGNRWET